MAYINKPSWMPCTLFERPVREDVTFRLRENSHKKDTQQNFIKHTLWSNSTWRPGCSWARNRQTFCQVMQTAFLRVSRRRSRKARAASNKCYYLGSCGASLSTLGLLLTVSSAALSSWEYLNKNGQYAASRSALMLSSSISFKKNNQMASSLVYSGLTVAVCL